VFTDWRLASAFVLLGAVYRLRPGGDFSARGADWPGTPGRAASASRSHASCYGARRCAGCSVSACARPSSSSRYVFLGASCGVRFDLSFTVIGLLLGREYGVGGLDVLRDGACGSCAGSASALVVAGGVLASRPDAIKCVSDDWIYTVPCTIQPGHRLLTSPHTVQTKATEVAPDARALPCLCMRRLQSARRWAPPRGTAPLAVARLPRRHARHWSGFALLERGCATNLWRLRLHERR